MPEVIAQSQEAEDTDASSNVDESTNASPTAYGWEFQKAAGVLLMLEVLKQCKGLNVEGRTEDIELELSKGRYIYAQAKSMEREFPAARNDGNYYDAAEKHLKKGIGTLIKAAKKTKEKGDLEALMYVFNMVAPFGMLRPTLHEFRGGDEYEYAALTPHEQKRINAKLKNAKAQDLLPLFENCFAMKCMSFPKTRKLETRYREILPKLQSFLSSIGIYPFLADELLRKLQSEIDGVVIGADFKLSKDDFIAMALELKMRIVESDFKDIFQTRFSVGKTRRMFKLYRETIASLSGSYFISNKIYSLFGEEYPDAYENDDMVSFALNNPSLVDDCVFVSSKEYSEDEIKLVKSALIYKMLDERSVFDNVAEQCYE